MHHLITEINNLKQTVIQDHIHKKIYEFSTYKNATNHQLFQELCFCILVANYKPERVLAIQQSIGDCFCTATTEELQQQFKQHHYRFPNIRACYITRSQKHLNTLKETITKHKGEQRRQWLIENIKGIGMKEASHFLRNIGYDNYAIIDTHILDLLSRHKLITKPKTLTPKRYLKIEKTLKILAEKTQLTLAELDLYLFYIETGKILK